MRRPVPWFTVLAVLVLAGCQQGKTTETTPPSPAPAQTSQAPQAQAASPEKEVVTPSGLHYQDLVVGDGILAEDGMQVLVNYTGWLTDGTKFDSSYDRNKPFEFTLGSGMVIRGWDEGVKGMRVGGKRKLTIPYDLAYGEEGRPGTIPPRATLVFDVELVNARKPQ